MQRSFSAAALLCFVSVLACGCGTIRDYPLTDYPVPSSDMLAVQQASNDDEAWRIARSTEDTDTLRSFLIRFPDSDHAAAAKSRIARLEGSAK